MNPRIIVERFNVNTDDFEQNLQKYLQGWHDIRPSVNVSMDMYTAGDFMIVIVRDYRKDESGTA